MSMTADELNRRLGNSLGWSVDTRGAGYASEDGSAWFPFSPATSVDDLRDYVLPEIERRGLKDACMNAVWYHCKGEWYTLVWYMATASPAVLAEAALEVLEGKG